MAAHLGELSLPSPLLLWKIKKGEKDKEGPPFFLFLYYVFS
jgi:hypothetical protein